MWVCSDHALTFSWTQRFMLMKAIRYLSGKSPSCTCCLQNYLLFNWLIQAAFSKGFSAKIRPRVYIDPRSHFISNGTCWEISWTYTSPGYRSSVLKEKAFLNKTSSFSKNKEKESSKEVITGKVQLFLWTYASSNWNKKHLVTYCSEKKLKNNPFPFPNSGIYCCQF